MADATAESGPLKFIVSHTDEIAQQVGDYGYIVADSLYLIVLGMLTVFVIHTLASKFLYPYLPNARLPRVIFGALYVLVLVVTVLIALKRAGFDTQGFGAAALVLVLVGASLLYFLIPFFPKLPFIPGHVIETGGVMGVVDSISSFHTTLRKFDGSLVFIPNALVVASRIENFSYTPTRRIEIKVLLASACEPEAVRARILAAVSEDTRVLTDPAAAIFATNADAAGVELTLYCWTTNEDYTSTRSDLWLRLLRMAREEEGIALATPIQEIQLRDGRAA
ncbi:MAG: mechanosensitive ion channel [Pseudomonadales bacterium]|nr:mechanosensitive ion channel [Halioglobus sp.]MCP5128450.1 mechanosensitive ion channel [Pseudomonadales bacterium]